MASSCRIHRSPYHHSRRNHKKKWLEDQRSSFHIHQMASSCRIHHSPYHHSRNHHSRNHHSPYHHSPYHHSRSHRSRSHHSHSRHRFLQEEEEEAQGHRFVP